MKPHTISKIYLVVGESGDCDETHNQWNVAAYHTLETANLHASEANREARERYENGDRVDYFLSRHSGAWDANPIGAPTYRVEAVPLNCIQFE